MGDIKENDMYLKASMQLLEQTYLKILRVNLTEDSHIDIKLRDFEKTESRGYRTKISEWLKEFAVTGQVYYADVDQYLSITDIHKLREHFRHSDEWVRVRYRRASGEEFRWVQMEIIKAADYTDDDQIVMLYIQDIHDSYVRELEERRELEYYCSTDDLTGLGNMYAYHNVCGMIADSIRARDIGVLFADLNGLKIVNDTRGHEAGNQYIRRFSEMLTRHFGHDGCYRISGDEFLVIRTDHAVKEFEKEAQEFDRLIKSENTPIAAIGWHCQSALAVETVVTKAETHMYKDKQLFYESHPEYKRDVVEQRFRNDADFLVDVLAESYKVLLIADLEQDTYRILRQKPTSVNQGESAEGIYSVRNDTFCDEFVSNEFMELRRHVGSIANLREQMKTKKHLICDYRLKDGQWRESTFWKMEGDEQGLPSKVMYYSQDIDHSMIDRLSRRTEAERKYSLIAGLREVYSAIFVIHLDTERVVLDENLTLPDMAANYFSGGKDCDEAREYLIREFLAEGQGEQFRKDTDLLSLRKALTDKKVVSFYYRIRSGFRKRDTYSYCKLSFSHPLNEEENLLILATKDITDVVNWARGGAEPGKMFVLKNMLEISNL